MAKKTKCKKKHINELYDWKMENFIYKYIDDQIMIDPISIWNSLKEAGVSELADTFLKSVIKVLNKEIEKNKKAEVK